MLISPPDTSHNGQASHRARRAQGLLLTLLIDLDQHHAGACGRIPHDEARRDLSAYSRLTAASPRRPGSAGVGLAVFGARRGDLVGLGLGALGLGYWPAG